MHSHIMDPEKATHRIFIFMKIVLCVLNAGRQSVYIYIFSNFSSYIVVSKYTILKRRRVVWVQCYKIILSCACYIFIIEYHDPNC